MEQRHIILTSLLIILLSFFSSQASLTGQAVTEQVIIEPVIQEPISSPYDLTDDGQVTTEDLQDIMDLASYEVYREDADFNNDGIVDQLDIDLLAASL